MTMQWVVWRLALCGGGHKYFTDIVSVDMASWRQFGFADYERCQIDLDDSYNITGCTVLERYDSKHNISATQ